MVITGGRGSQLPKALVAEAMAIPCGCCWNALDLSQKPISSDIVNEAELPRVCASAISTDQFPLARMCTFKSSTKRYSTILE